MERFEDMLGFQLIGNAGLQVGAGIWWPLMLFLSFGEKISQEKIEVSLSEKLV